MSGTKASSWEGHMAEIMWRSEAKANTYQRFFDLLREVYPLHRPAEYSYSTPLFDSWDGFGGLNEGDTVYPVLSDAETTDSDVLELEAAERVLQEVNGNSRDPATAPPVPVAVQPPDVSPIASSTAKHREDSTELYSSGRAVSEKSRSKMVLLSDLLEDSSDDSSLTADRTITTSTPVTAGKMHKTAMRTAKPKYRSDHVCCPTGFAPTKQEGKNRHTRVASATAGNPYRREAYVWGADFSSDDDFQVSKPSIRPKTPAKPRHRSKCKSSTKWPAGQKKLI